MANARTRGLNPLLVHSLRQFARSRRKLGQRPLGQVIILGAAAVAYVVSVYSWWRMIGPARPTDEDGFHMVVCLLMVALGLLVPSLSAGVFAQERQNGTLDLLLTCPLSNRELVRGKVLGQLMGPLAICALALPFLIMAAPTKDAYSLWGASLAVVPAEVAALVCLGVYCSARFRSAAGARGAATGIALLFGLLLPMLDMVLSELAHHNEPTWSQIVSPPIIYAGLAGAIKDATWAALGPVFLLGGAMLCFALLENRFDKLVRFAEHRTRRSADA